MPDHKPRIVTREERRQLGRSCRTRSSALTRQTGIPNTRKQDVIDLLLGAQQGRIPGLLPIKWDHMAASPFGFFRGAVPLMAADLAPLPHTGLTAQICGDAHVQNLGAFEAPDGRLIFDINDFDETIIGPWEWDVKRMSASLVLAGREAGNSDKQCKNAVLAFAAQISRVDAPLFRNAGRRAGAFSDLSRDRSRALGPSQGGAGHAAAQSGEADRLARRQARLSRPEADAISRFAKEKRTPPWHPCALTCKRSCRNERTSSSQYQVEDVAFRVVGTGSVGLRDYVLLMFARC